MTNLTGTDKKIINRYIEEYNDFSMYLPQSFIEKEYIYFFETYNAEENINIEIQFGLHIQNKINYELCNHIRNGNIELEIELINKHMTILNMLIRKLKISHENIDKEKILITSLETYDGSKTLSSHILDVLKNRNKVSNDLGEVSEIQKVKEDIAKEDNFQLSDIHPKDFNTTIEEYIETNDVIPDILLDLDKLFIKLNIIDLIEDENFKKYAYLRFGYYNNFNFADEDIANILNVETKDLQLMYKKCLIILKKAMNEKIDLVIGLYLNNLCPQRQYIKLS